MNTTAPIHNNEEEAMSRIIIKFKAGKKASVLSKVGLGGDTTTASLFNNNNNGSNNNNVIVNGFSDPIKPAGKFRTIEIKVQKTVPKEKSRWHCY